MQNTRFITDIKQKNPKSENISIVILSSVMQPRTKTIGPISLLELNSKQNVMDHQIAALKIAYPKSEVILVCGYESHKISNLKPKGLKIIENPFFEERGNAEEIRLALNIVNNKTVMIIDGYTIFNPQAISLIDGHASSILIKETNDGKDNVGCYNDSGPLKILAYGHNNIWQNIGIFEERELTLIQKFVNIKSKNKYCYHEIINYVINNGGRINVVSQKFGFIQRIDDIKEINETSFQSN